MKIRPEALTTSDETRYQRSPDALLRRGSLMNLPCPQCSAAVFGVNHVWHLRRLP